MHKSRLGTIVIDCRTDRLDDAVGHPSRVHLDIETDDLDAELKRLETLVVQPQRPDFESGANVWS